MHTDSIDQWTHEHVFLGEKHEHNERRTWFVVALTAVMMIGEIAAGTLFGSMALLADGWHMATHAVALGIFGDLAAFSSAIILGMIAAQIAYESVLRLINPVPISYVEAIAVASLGLCVNLASAWILRDSHDHHHGHGFAHDDHDHEHAHHHHDHHHHHDNNLRAAYVHVLADAATSVLAIGALVVAMVSGWVWADPAVGIVGSLVIASWAIGLIRDAGAVLLDVSFNRKLQATIRARLEAGDDRITDLHLWQVGPGHCAAVISLVSEAPRAPATYKERLRDLKGLSHVTVEVERCPH
jgi:cation diffusion facilitator family transporter